MTRPIPKDRVRYRKVSQRTWGDLHFRNLTAPPPCGRYLWIYLLTGPRTTNIPGCINASPAVLAADLGWPMDAALPGLGSLPGSLPGSLGGRVAASFREAWGEVCREGLAKADEKAGLIWLPRGPAHNKPESPNVVLSWRDTWDLLPECPLKYQIWLELKAFAEGWGAPFAKAFREALGDMSPNQEQEQEQEQEYKKESPMNGDAPAASPPAPKKMKKEPPQTSVEALEVAKYLLEAICTHTDTFTASDQKIAGWARDVDLAMRIDGRSPADLRRVIDFAHRSSDTFWRPNLLSGEKLREKYDQLVIQANRKRGDIRVGHVRAEDQDWAGVESGEVKL